MDLKFDKVLSVTLARELLVESSFEMDMDR